MRVGTVHYVWMEDDLSLPDMHPAEANVGNKSLSTRKWSKPVKPLAQPVERDRESVYQALQRPMLDQLASTVKVTSGSKGHG